MIRLNHLFPNIDDLSLDPMGATFNGNPEKDELNALFRIATYIHAQTVFEIGIYTGSTALALSTLPTVKKVWTLDLPPETLPILPIDVDDWWYIAANKVELPDKVEQLYGDSALFDFSPYYGKVNLVFVMGAHSAEYIFNDVAAAQKMVSVNGVIVLHSGIVEAMEQVKDMLPLDLINERMAIVRKE